MRNYQQVLQTIGGIALALLGVVLLLSAAKNDSERVCTGLKIKMIDDTGQYIVSTKDVENWATQNGIEKFNQMPIDEINLAHIEKRITKGGIVKTCEAYIDLNSKLTLKVEVYKPIARVLANNGTQDRYMDKEGHFFPLSHNFKPTVLLLSGDFFNNRNGIMAIKNKDLLDFILRVSEDDFWSTQITQIDVDKYKNINLVPFLGEHTIEFGKPKNIEHKLEKLIVFYKKILPQSKWSSFEKVSVKYDGQIVCN